MEDCGSTSDGTDQESEGTIIATAAGITDCPANALMTWLGAAGITKAGTISRVRLTDRSVANVVKLYAGRMGLDAQHCHSLSSGFLTSAAANGASIFKMMDVSRHKSINNLRTYVRDAELFKNHAGAGLL